jgi:2-oxoacid:acceptor oxidoreductase gamma subunit (pyruvate/2-ketoisovalerate family)/2-oxoacid:acceptor oxidoreductase delta subunit (pyruvate/2-ketoisovalerate family)
MKEMLFVGRGGEGVVLASQILADTLGRAGFHVQAFPEFTAERRGAPIAAYLRWDEGPIRRRYKMRDCDVLAVVSPSPTSAAVLARIRPGGLLLLNAESRFTHSATFHVARVPASRIARRHAVLSAEGRAMGNIALLGGCLRLLLPDRRDLLEDAIRSRFGSGAERNVLAAREGYDRCVVQRTLPGDTAIPKPDAVPHADRPRYPMSTTDSRANRTGAWSLERPLLSPTCTGCAVCALFCPEGAMSRTADGMVVDYVHCKGCGICVDVCPVRDAIAMEELVA